MDLDNLDEAEVQTLINRLKYSMTINGINEIYNYISSMFGKVDKQEPIIDEDDLKYILKVYRGRVETTKFSMHLRFAEFHHHLVRIDIDPDLNHINPDNRKIIGSHIHIYSNSYETRDTIAIPLSESGFPNITGIVDAFTEFLNYNNIK